MRFGGEMKKLWSFEDKRAKLSANFAAETPFGRVFRSCETTFWHTSAIYSTVPLILKLRNEPRNQFWAAKSLLSYEMGCENSPLLRNPPPAAKMLQASKMVCEIAHCLQNDLQVLKRLRNHLQAYKWPSNCEIDLQNGGRFAKTPYKAKRSC
ncbi:hypothetical protein VitviT2T_021879 [Vitis vinifera]|uniref:Uncharacterized protein n=1 Tax=Vitis vinifera TaxID=29760 RepID=A0ABY9D8A6_VITVI|nr:hypothetical protein VitviT2T_021879 [Vitis vinifera]